MDIKIISPNLKEDHLFNIIKGYGAVKYVKWDFEGSALKKGDGYLSEVYKVVVTGEDQKG